MESVEEWIVRGSSHSAIISARAISRTLSVDRQLSLIEGNLWETIQVESCTTRTLGSKMNRWKNVCRVSPTPTQAANEALAALSANSGAG